MANTWGKMETVTDFIFLGSKITADADCSHDIKRHLLGTDQTRQPIKKQRHYLTNKGSSSQSCILSPCLFNLYAEYIMKNAGLEEAQAGIKISGRKNNLRHTDDTTLNAESEA